MKHLERWVSVRNVGSGCTSTWNPQILGTQRALSRMVGAVLLSASIAVVAFAVPRGRNSENQLKPVILLYERNPWLMVGGSDSPTFALYENGKAIFLTPAQRYASVSLEEKERDELIASLQLDQGFFELADHYETVSKTDQPTNALIVRYQERSKRVVVYGGIRNDPEARAKTPPAFLGVFDRLISYQNSQAKRWLPERIEVLVWLFNYAHGAPRPWPKGWPDLYDPATKKRQELYSIYLSSSHFDELMKLLSSLQQDQALLMNGKKWAISFRLPFPHE